MIHASTGIQLANKKAPQATVLEGLHPVFLTLFCVTTMSVGRGIIANWQGRSSDSPACSAAFPSLLDETVAFSAEQVPFVNEKGRGYSGGTAPEFNGIPY
jgi:hypothetical protein